MSQNKVKIGISIDPDLLAAIDEVCEAKEAKRSTIIERMLSQAIKIEQRHVADMEKPFFRFFARRPELMQKLAAMSGEKMTELEFAELQHAADLGESRRAVKKQTKKGTKS